VLIDHGTLIESDAVEHILSRDDPVKYIKKYLEGRTEVPLVLTLDDVRASESLMSFDGPSVDGKGSETCEGETAEDTEEGVEETPAEPEPPAIKPGRSPEDTAFKIIMDITGNSTCDGSIDNFTRYFRDRFTVLRRMIKGRMEMSGTIKISRARHVERDVKIIGMVSETGVSKKGHVTLTLEDDSGTIFVLIPKSSEWHSHTILKDEVIGVVGKVSSGDRGPKGRERSTMLIPDAIYRPDIPVVRTPRRSENDIEVVFISDIHVGSAHFLPDAWNLFLEWIRGKEAAKVKYIVVAGDLVDGIGIYPNQQDELTIPNITEQYEELVRLMEPIPAHIEVIMQPGNHDAVRPAEPQPALPQELVKGFGSNFRFVGNPCYFSIDGVEILSYHGRGIDDLVATIPGIQYQDPHEAMMEMLGRRHLAITYGAKTPLAPEAKDYLIINPVPDIFVTGHVHRTSVQRYRNITMINSSAWQSQTPFQLMHNFHPDPGKIVIVNLKTGRCRVKAFHEEK